MSWLDWLILAIYAAAMVGIGRHYSGSNATSDDFVLGGRSMSPVAVGLSLFATLVSTLSYLGNTGEMISYGPMMMTQLVAHPFIFLIVGFGLIPLLMKQPVTSAYEILEKRLGPNIRMAGAAVFLLLRLGWLATILYATSSLVLVPMLGLDPKWVPWLCLIIGLLTAWYSSLGGIRAVVATDALQSITMIAGAAITLVVVSARLGGVAAWWPNHWPDHWQRPSWGFDPDVRVSFGVLFLSTTMWYVCTNGSDQMSIQRFLSTRDASAARRTLAVSQITDALVAFLLGLTGIALLGFYTANPPVLEDGKTLQSAGDQLFTIFIMNEMPSGLAGIVLAAILSAALSSMSSGINSACAVIERDFVSGQKGRSQEGADVVRRMRITTWLVAFAAIGVSLLNLLITGNLLERCFTMINLLTAPLFVLFFLALFIPWSNAAGAWAGLFSSTLVAVAIAYGPELQLPVHISFVWIMPCSLITGIAVGTLVSKLFPAGDRISAAR